jgi:hypothetical protein
MPSYTQGQENKRPEFLPEGVYDYATIGAAEKVSTTGNEMIELKIELIGPDIKEDAGPIIYENLVFTEKAFFKIDQFRASIGEAIQEGEEVSIDAEDLTGKTGKCQVIVETYKGKTRNKVAKFLAAEGGPF